MTRIPRETVRYLYKQHILKKRIRVLREIDHEKLGLSYIQFLVKFSPGVESLFNSARSLVHGTVGEHLQFVCL